MTSAVSRRDFVRDSALAAAGLAVGLTPTLTVHAGNPEKSDTSKILNYNADMEYRRCGKTNLMISAVCLGGHWKRLNTIVPDAFKGASWLAVNGQNEDFLKNRTDVVTRCIERGINYIDACTGEEVMAYAHAIKGRRDKMYLGYSWYQHEVRFAAWRSLDKLKESFDAGLKATGLEYVDLWRITCHEQSGKHTEEEFDAVIKALEWAKKSGRARFTGISSHDRNHIKAMIEKYPEQLEVIVTPYTTKTKVVDDSTGLWAAMKKLDVGWFGIKPFSSGSLFKGNSAPDSEHRAADDEIARLTIRRILMNPAITAPIPGMISPQQVDNLVAAIKQPRELDPGEQARLDEATDRAWANLPYHYQWLKDWEYV